MFNLTIVVIQLLCQVIISKITKYHPFYTYMYYTFLRSRNYRYYCVTQLKNILLQWMTGTCFIQKMTQYSKVSCPMPLTHLIRDMKSRNIVTI
jgi:hypothetical protein